MSSVNTINGDFVAQGARFAIVAGRFNSYIVDHLLAGAIDTLVRHGVEAKSIDVVHAPGAFEIPLAAQRVAATKQYDGIIALGCVIRGATPHFDYVAGEAAKGIAQVSLDSGVPVMFGVLTTETIEQAIERAGSKAGNKGADCALAALEMINLLAQL